MSTATPRVSDAAIRQLRETMELPDAGARFDVRQMIGQGGMGRVYAVYDRLLEREVAMKVLSLDAETPAFIQRITREARVLARLEHPGIAAVYDAGMLSDGRPYYLMRLVRGTSLAQPHALGSRGDRLRAFLRICDTVAFAHARGVIHRDIKPGNVMLGEYGDVVVLDWGVAKVLAPLAETDAETNAETAAVQTTAAITETSTETITAPIAAAVSNGVEFPNHTPPRPDPLTTGDGVAVGTPGFMAPEQSGASSTPVDVRADVYGLGALLHFMLTGRHHRDSTAYSGTPLPRPLVAIISRATAEVPTHRYDTAQQVADDVRRWMDAEPVTAYRERPWEVAARFYHRNRTLLLLLVAYVVVRVGIVWWRGV